MIKRLPSLALALLMTFSFLPFSALADNLQTITSVSIGEYNPPVIGEVNSNYIGYSSDDPFTHLERGQLFTEKSTRLFASVKSPIDEVSVRLEFFPPADQKPAAYSSGIYVDNDADYEVVDAYWYCYNINGSTNGGYPRRIEDDEPLWWTGEYCFCIKLQPKAGCVFADSVTFSLTDNGGEPIPISEESHLNGDGTIDIRTGVTKAASYVLFCNSWAGTSYRIMKDTVLGEIGVPSWEGYIFDGWFTDDDCTEPYDPTAPIEKDTTVYPKWLRASGPNDIDHVAIEIAAPIAGEQAENCRASGETGKHYTVVPYWYCRDNTYGGETGLLLADDIFYAGNQYSLKIRVIPDERYWFNKDLNQYTVRYKGNDIEIENSYYENGELIIWTLPIESVEYVFFNNAWGMAGDNIPKGTIFGEIFEPCREDGIRFGGWYTDPSRTVPYDPTAPIMVDTTVYPKWIDETTGNPLISYVSVEIAPPRADKAPSYEIVIPDGAQYYNDTDRDGVCRIDGIAWYHTTDQGGFVSPNEHLVRGNKYGVEINLTADSGYVFDQYLIAELNGSEVEFSIDSIDSGRLRLDYSFDEPVLSDDDYCGEHVTWEYFDGVLTISGTGDMYNYESVRDTPWYSISDDIEIVIVKKGVTSVGDNAFYWCDKLTSVELRSSVTSIGKWAFGYCRKIQTVSLPSDLTSIGDYAFYDCRAINGIYIPPHVISIGKEAFWNCEKITDIFIPDGVKSIGYYAFGDCSALTYVAIPASVTSIGDAVFASCDSLTSVDIDSGNSGYCFENGVLFNKNKTKLIQYLITNTASSYTIPDGVTGIGARAFENNTSLTTLTIPGSVTGFSIYAFKNCSGLTDIYYGGIEAQWEAVTSASVRKELENVTVHFVSEPPEPLPGGTCGESSSWLLTTEGTLLITGTGDIYDYEFEGGPNTTPPWFQYKYDIVSVVIGSGIERIGNFAFSQLTKCENIYISDSVTSIADGAFCGCTGLTGITIPDSVTSIGEWAFYGCTGLTDITIPDSVTSIGECAFYECTGLTSITIPDSVTSIGVRVIGNYGTVIKTYIYSEAYYYAIDNDIQFELIQERMAGHSVSLSDVVDLNFYFELFHDASYYDVTIRYGNGNEETTWFSSDFTRVENGETLYGVKCTMPIKEMSDLITVKVTYGDTTTPYSYSVRKYCESLLKDSNASVSTEEEKEVARELLKYADWAIYFFDYEPYVNGTPEGIAPGEGGTGYQGTEPDTSALSSVEDVLSSLGSKTTMTIQNGSDRSVKFDGMSLVLESSIRYRAYFTFADADTAQSYIEMATDGNELIQVGNTNQYYIEKDSTSIVKLGEDMIFRLGDITITSNPLYYIELSLWSDSSDDLKHLCIAIYDYYSAVMEMIQAR